MADNSEGKLFAYDAFLSYSYSDKDFAEALQRNLEKNFFRVSKKIRGKDKEKLIIIRDRTDIEGGEDIVAHFTNKIKECRHFIVICSENLKERPQWVEREILDFKNDRQQDSLRRLIVINYLLREPVTRDSFPEPLVGQDGSFPLAEDARDFRDFRKRKFPWQSPIDIFQLKIFAQLLNIDFDNFVLRHRRYLRRKRNEFATWIVLGASVILLSFYTAFSYNRKTDFLVRQNALRDMKQWIEEIQAYKAIGVVEYQRSWDSANAYYEKYPQDPAFQRYKKILNSLKIK